MQESGGDIPEQRGYIRFSLKTHVNFQIKRPGEAPASLDSPAHAITKDISMRGICFSASRRLMPGNALKLFVFFERNKKPIHLEGKVAWCMQQKGREMFDMGVELLSIDKTDEKEFMGYIRKRAAETENK